MGIARSRPLTGLAGVAGGYAPLDSGLLVPIDYLPSIPSDKLPGNLWTMRKNGSSQTLTASTVNTIAFDTADVDGGGGVIDLTNDWFVVPADGMYLALTAWPWESTVPGDYECAVHDASGLARWPMLRPSTVTSIDSFGTVHGVFPMTCVEGDELRMRVNPGSPSNVTARGNASPNLATMFALVRLT